MKNNILKARLAKVVMVSLLITMFSACSKGENDYYEVKTDKSEIIFESNDNTQTFNIISKGDWHIDAEGLQKGYGTVSGTADWYIVDRVWGSGNSTVTILLRENQSGNHTATLTIAGDHNKVNLNIKKQATE